MEQDGNTAMPKSPDFSSPNNPVNTSSAVDQSNSQDIAAAAAALPENDRPAITSAPGATNSHMFGRHFKPQASKAQQATAPVSPTFAGAPDFFNEAAAKNSDYITIGQDDAKRSNKKRFIIIGALVALIAVVGVVALAVPKMQNNAQQDLTASDGFKKSFYSFVNLYNDGEESDSRLTGKYDSSKDVYATKHLDDNEYFKKLRASFDEFYGKYENEKSANDVYEDYISEYKDYFELVYNNRSIPWLNETEYIHYYYFEKDGKDIIEKYVDNIKGDGTSVESYKDLLRKNISIMGTINQRYIEGKCTVNDVQEGSLYTEEYVCMQKNHPDLVAEINTSRAEMLKLREQSINEYYSSMDRISQLSWNIEDIMDGKYDKE